MNKVSSNNQILIRNFKILGIRPLKDCAKYILKNLVEDEPYMFYNNYKFENGKVMQIHKASVPVDFYSNNVSIHAIVGKNGCGKSSIIELLFRLINNLAYVYLHFENYVAADPLGYVKGLAAEFYYEKDNHIYIVRQTSKEPESIVWTDNEGNSLLNGKNKIELENLFYTLVINYSHYAYNISDYQKEIFNKYSKYHWIQSIFRKNDGYETPIAVNPYRQNGDIGINTENNLATARLTSLFIKAELEKKNFHEKYSLAAFDLKLEKEGNLNKKYNSAKEYWSELNHNFHYDFKIINDKIIDCWTICTLQIKDNIDKDDQLIKRSRKYLVYKTISVIYKYPIFTDYFNALLKKYANLKEEDKLDKVLSLTIERLNNDTSHVTLKLHQTIWFITLQQYQIKNNFIIDDIKKMIYKHSGGDYSLDRVMNLLPPPIFSPIIKLKYKTEKNRTARIELTSLSSGERQQLYSISSLLYHLVNLNSVKDVERIKYRNIEVVLEEIELYYHPEYQRSYIQFLIDRINMLQLDSDLHIDICVLTHSPIVLSDIPLENILFLDEGKPKELESDINTFGSNMYDLLKYNFFLKDNAFGEFASNKMKAIISLLKKKDISNENKEKIEQTIALIGDKLIAKILTQYF